jgi:hypothetical protein
MENSVESVMAQKLHFASALHKHTHASRARLPVSAAQSLE